MDALYLPLYLYCEFADRPYLVCDKSTYPTVEARQFAVFDDDNQITPGCAILELIERDDAQWLYVFASRDCFLDGVWFLVFETLDFGPEEGIFASSPRFNEMHFPNIFGSIQLEFEIEQLLIRYSHLRQSLERY